MLFMIHIDGVSLKLLDLDVLKPDLIAMVL